MTGEGALDADGFLAGGELHLLPWLNLAEGKLGLELGKAGGKVGLLLLGVERLLDEIAGRPIGEAGERISMELPSM